MRAPPATIEALQERDIEAISAIHEKCFDDAWSAQMIRRILATAGAFGLVARTHEDGPVAAFALGRVIVDECELLSLGVAPEARRMGLTVLPACVNHSAWAWIGRGRELRVGLGQLRGLRQAAGISAQVWHVPYLFQGAGASGGDSRCDQGQLVSGR